MSQFIAIPEASPRIRAIAEKWYANGDLVSTEELAELYAWVCAAYALAVDQAKAEGRLAPRGAAISSVSLALGWSDPSELETVDGRQCFRAVMLVVAAHRVDVLN